MTGVRILFPLGTLVALIFYGALVLPHYGYFPLWDSLELLQSYLFLPKSSLTFSNLFFTHNHHPSFGYFWIFWLGQWVFPNQILAVHVLNTMIGCIAIIAFGYIVETVYGQYAGALERSLITVAFAVHPVVVANGLNLSADYGVLAYFLAALGLLYAERWGWAAVAGTLLVFSKEVGVAYYLLLCVLTVAGLSRPYRPRRLWPLLIPLGTFGIFCLSQWITGNPIFPWYSSGFNLQRATPLALALPNPLAPPFKMAFLSAFIFQFQWIFTAFTLAGLLRALIKKPKEYPSHQAFGGTFKRCIAEVAARWRHILLPFRCFTLLLLGALYIDSRILHYTNPRYLIVLFPLLLLSFFSALQQLRLPKSLRAGILAASVAILFCCNFRTWDPVSEIIAGTFPFGHHSMIKITSVRPECCGYGRDQLVYNLEHTHISYLLDKAFAEIRPNNHTVIAIPNDSWLVMAKLNATTFQRTESKAIPVVNPVVADPGKIATAADKPEKIWLILLPYLDNKHDIEKLFKDYALQSDHVFSDDGYELQVLELHKKIVEGN